MHSLAPLFRIWRGDLVELPRFPRVSCNQGGSLYTSLLELLGAMAEGGQAFKLVSSIDANGVPTGRRTRRRAAEREAERLDFLKLQARLATERPGARWTPAQTTAAAGFPLLCIVLVLVLFLVFAREVSDRRDRAAAGGRECHVQHYDQCEWVGFCF